MSAAAGLRKTLGFAIVVSKRYKPCRKILNREAP